MEASESESIISMRPKKRARNQKHAGFNCAVADCYSTQGKGFCLHKFPEETETRRQWVKFVLTRRSNFGPSFGTPNAYSRVCMLHFRPECYPPKLALAESFGMKVRNRRLLPNSVPTIQKPGQTGSLQPTTTTTEKSSRTAGGHSHCTVKTVVNVKNKRGRKELWPTSEVVVDSLYRCTRVITSGFGLIRGALEKRERQRMPEHPAARHDLTIKLETNIDDKLPDNPAVKIEIDVAEDPSLFWGISAEQHTHGSAKDTAIVTNATFNIHTKPSSSSPAVFSRDSCVGLKQEVADQSTDSCVGLKQEVVDQSTDSCVRLKQTGVDQSTDSYMWLKQEVADQSTDSCVGLKQEVVDENTDSCVRLKQEVADENTDSCVRLKQEVADQSTDSCVRLKQEVADQSSDIHSEQTSFLCSQCDATIKEPGDFRSHVCIPSGPFMPFACSVCGATFPKAGLLLSHMHIHPDYRPVACSQCSSSFRNFHSLGRHMRVHSTVSL